MAARSTAPVAAAVPLGEWLATLPQLEGVRPVDSLPAARSSATATALADAGGLPQRPSYRRQRPPGEAVPSVPQQDVYSLVREAGVLRWRLGTVSAIGPRPRAGSRAGLPSGQVVKQFAFERLAPSQVYSALVALDKMLTPSAVYADRPGTGLRRWHGGALVPFPDARQASGKKVLLFVHGTFSNAETLLEHGLQRSAAGNRLLADAVKHYDLVLAFDHPTLSVSPMLNAFDLAAQLRPAPAAVDIVCHSRGGLVSRWFCEAFADAALRRRVLFVASPLAGTSLAAAPRLKSALDLLTNIADMLRGMGESVAAQSMFMAASGLMRVIGTVTGGAVKGPLLDAAIALVPGLDAQSRVGNNQELVRLRANTGTADFSSGPIRYFALRSNFEPRDIGWNFLRLFSKPLQRLGDFGADLIFDGANDLVVDTASMAEVADAHGVPIVHDFGTTDRVHHCNYFVQPETVAAVRKAFGIPAG